MLEGKEPTGRQSSGAASRHAQGFAGLLWRGDDRSRTGVAGFADTPGRLSLVFLSAHSWSPITMKGLQTGYF